MMNHPVEYINDGLKKVVARTRLVLDNYDGARLSDSAVLNAIVDCVVTGILMLRDDSALAQYIPPRFLHLR